MFRGDFVFGVVISVLVLLMAGAVLVFFVPRLVYPPSTVFGSKIIERHWEEAGTHRFEGTLYLLAKGEMKDENWGRNGFEEIYPPYLEDRFKHTTPGLGWWSPDDTPSRILFHEGFYEQSPEHSYDPNRVKIPMRSEILISTKGNLVYYESRRSAFGSAAGKNTLDDSQAGGSIDQKEENKADHVR